MAPINEDLDIRAALAELTEGQPPVPPGRLAGIRRRASAQRRRRMITAVVAAAAAVGVVLTLAKLPAVERQPQVRRVPGWALPWPDHRNGSVPQSVLNRAVIAWLYQGPLDLPDGGIGTVPAPGSSARQVADLASSYRVVWYVGQTIDHGSSVVVTFEVDLPIGPELVVGQAQASSVMRDQPAWSRSMSPWAFTTTAAPSPNKPALVIGQYAGGTASPYINWVVLLTAPDVRSVTWFASTPHGVRRQAVRTPAGLGVADAGQLTSQVKLTGMSTSGGFVPLPNVPVGIPGATGVTVPDLAPPAALSTPASLGDIEGYWSQGSQQNEDSSFAPGRGRYALLGVCYGPRPLHLSINSHHVGTIVCDNHQQQVMVPASALRRHGIIFNMDTSSLTAWQVEFTAVHNS